MSRQIDKWRGTLAGLPGGLRVMLTAFLAIIGFGYLTAIANIYHRHQHADGRPGLSTDDVRAVYSGLTVAANEPAPSRMLTMLRGAMREYAGDEDDFKVLESWLAAGGSEAGLDEGPPKKAPRRAIIRNCLRCHAKSTGTDISRRSPFGPDEFEVDYAMLRPLAAAGVESSGQSRHVPPQYTMARLVLVSHMHMLSIPMFTLVVGLLFMMSRLPVFWRSALAPLPMLALFVDFAGWWLARLSPASVYLLILAGAVFGVAFGVQLIAVTIDLWRPARMGGQAA